LKQTRGKLSKLSKTKELKKLFIEKDVAKESEIRKAKDKGFQRIICLEGL